MLTAAHPASYTSSPWGPSGVIWGDGDQPRPGFSWKGSRRSSHRVVQVDVHGASWEGSWGQGAWLGLWGSASRAARRAWLETRADRFGVFLLAITMLIDEAGGSLWFQTWALGRLWFHPLFCLPRRQACLAQQRSGGKGSDYFHSSSDSERSWERDRKPACRP